MDYNCRIIKIIIKITFIEIKIIIKLIHTIKISFMNFQWIFKYFQ